MGPETLNKYKGSDTTQFLWLSKGLDTTTGFRLGYYPTSSGPFLTFSDIFGGPKNLVNKLCGQ
jgi:hypothetical protein